MKIAIIGAGNVGASVASALVLRGVCEHIVLVDIFGDIAQAKAMDLAQSAAVFGMDVSVQGGADFALITGADIVVNTAGSPRKEGQTREDLLVKNAQILKGVASEILKFAPNALLINVANPLDVLTYALYAMSGFEAGRVMGMAGELDSARLKFELGAKFELPNSAIKAHVIGAHNDEMLVSAQNIGLNLSPEQLEQVARETKTGGAKIVRLLGTSAYYAPAAGVVKMCEAIRNESEEWLSCCVVIGKNLASGRQVRLGRNGVREIKEPSAHEAAAIEKSENEIRHSVEFLAQSGNL